MGWCAADDVVSRLPPSSRATGGPVERRRSRRTTICRLHPGCELDFPAFVARPARRIHRCPYERRAGTARSREAVTACRAWAVRMRVDQMGERGSTGRSRRARHQPDERVRGRTHQTRRHDLAREYAPAEIQTAATPVRVEKRRGPAGLEDRIVGIVWGGTKPIDRLEIRLGAADAWRPFSICPRPRTHVVWALWEYRWKPETTGLYSIALRVPDPSVPQRRLHSGYYMRQVKIDEV